MAITTTTLNGTDSVAASRITINDNFATILDALNDVLSMIDISTGNINTYGYGSGNSITTQDLTVRGSVGGGLNVISGNVNVSVGNIVIGGTSSTGFLQIGAGSNAVVISNVVNVLGSGNIPTLNLSGVGTTGGAGTVGYVTIPRTTAANVRAIQNPALGSIVYVSDTNIFAICTASGTTGTWLPVLLGATAI